MIAKSKRPAKFATRRGQLVLQFPAGLGIPSPIQTLPNLFRNLNTGSYQAWSASW